MPSSQYDYDSVWHKDLTSFSILHVVRRDGVDDNYGYIVYVKIFC